MLLWKMYFAAQMTKYNERLFSWSDGCLAPCLPEEGLFGSIFDNTETEMPDGQGPLPQLQDTWSTVLLAVD